MDMISHLPDELLLRILSFLPNTAHVVETMVLSKRWQFLWKVVPRLVYDETNSEFWYAGFLCFVDTSLSMHESLVIETLHFKIGKLCNIGDIRKWITTANKRRVRELIIEVCPLRYKGPSILLPLSLYSVGSRMLVALKLSNLNLTDDSSPISFPCLKKLSLKSIMYPSDEFAKRLLSSCHVLEDLVVEHCPDDNIIVFNVVVPSLKRSFLHTTSNRGGDKSHKFVIDAPCLESLDVFHSTGFCVIENNMTKLVDASLALQCWDPRQKLSSITSLKRLYLCLPTSKGVYPVGSIFGCLVYLKICTCETEWLNLFMRLLKDAPNLKSLKLQQCHIFRSTDLRPCWNPCWNEQSSVPECLISSLENFEWLYYKGTEEEKEVVAFIFRSASCLKNVTIIAEKSIESDKRLEMREELFLSARRSPDCELTFS